MDPAFTKGRRRVRSTGIAPPRKTLLQPVAEPTRTVQPAFASGGNSRTARSTKFAVAFVARSNGRDDRGKVRTVGTPLVRIPRVPSATERIWVGPLPPLRNTKKAG